MKGKGMKLNIPPPNNPVFQNLLPTASAKCGFSSDNPEKANNLDAPALHVSDVRGKTAFHQADNVDVKTASGATAQRDLFSCIKILLWFSFITLVVIMLMPGLSIIEKILGILVVGTLSWIFAKLIASLG
jgi:hypothetical protein